MDKTVYVNNAYAIESNREQVIVVADSVVERVECRRCGGLFVRDETTKVNTASWYRCKKCLSTKSFLVDLAYSCTIS